jgi:SAM-dependent methyltransferase
MSLDVTDLRAFYATALGDVARRVIGSVIAARWPSVVGQSVLGLGYALPYLEARRDEAMRAIAFFPATLGAVGWPAEGPSGAALVESDLLPLPDACIDHALVVHCLEATETPRLVLEDIWRVLAPQGRLIVVVPSRRGIWARVDGTPFGQGQPFSRGQMREMLRDTLFSPMHVSEVLYTPPVPRRSILRLARAFERLGVALSLPGAGVIVVEAGKQLYRPVLARTGFEFARPRLARPRLLPAGSRAERR